MTDQELANRLVAHGVGRVFATEPGIYYLPDDTPTGAMRFVRDWRVAGAMLQKWPTTINTEHLDMTLDEMLRDPRAINEACCEALDNE